MMSDGEVIYPGSASLPPEVRARVLTTFEHLKDLARQGQTADVTAGCELLLKMDPLFEPAKELLAGTAQLAASSAPPERSAADKLAQARRAVDARDFQTAIELTNEVLRIDLTNEEAQRLGDQAQERLEAGPFVEQFVAKARTFAEKGNLTASRAELAKAKALDPAHPSIAEFERTSAPSVAPPVNAPTEPRGRKEVEPSAFDFGSPENSPFDFSTGGAGNTVAPPSSSFVVDAPQTSSRSAAASDFGFSFEEDQHATAPPVIEHDSAFSFGDPAPVVTPSSHAPGPVVGEAQTFDFTTASVETTAEDQARIEQLLAQGDEAFAAGEFQRATDIWSRVFLIDVTNHGASERIEKARAKQDELDTRVDSLMSAASTASAKGDNEKARSLYEEVLRIDPMNQAAATAISELARPAAVAGTPAVTAPDEAGDLADMYSGALLENYEEFSDRPAAVGGEGIEASTRSSKPQQTATPRKSNRMVMFAIAGLLVLAIGGYFGWNWWSSRDSGNQGSEQTQLAILRAQALARQGKIDEAVALLSAVPANDPEHEKVLDLLADLKGRKPTGPALIDGRPASDVFAELVNGGMAAFQTHDYIGARDALQKAAAIQPLPADAKGVLENSIQQVEKLDSALVLFKEGNYASAIQNLEALQQQDSENQNVKQLIENAHYDLGATALRSDRLDDAIAEFDAVLKTNPDDEMARRSREIADRYKGQQKDLLYRIYVKYLPLR